MNSASVLAIIALALVLAVAVGVAARRRAAAPQVPVQFTRHAQTRMVQRGITASQVQAVVADPARRHTDPAQGSVRLERDFGDRTLKVWVAQPWPTPSGAVVKTTAWSYQITIPTGSIGRVIGTRGATIRTIEDITGTHIFVRPDGTTHIGADNPAAFEAARDQITNILNQPPADPCAARPA